MEARDACEKSASAGPTDAPLRRLGLVAYVSRVHRRLRLQSGVETLCRGGQDRCRLGLAVNPVDDSFGVVLHTLLERAELGQAEAAANSCRKLEAACACRLVNHKHEGLLSLASAEFTRAVADAWRETEPILQRIGRAVPAGQEMEAPRSGSSVGAGALFSGRGRGRPRARSR